MIHDLRIRLYADSDYKEIVRWNRKMGTTPPKEDHLTYDSTFILEKGGEAWACVTVYQMPIKAWAHVEHLSSNPDLPTGKERKMAVGYLQEFLEGWARKRGYKALWCMSKHAKLTERFEELGYKETLRGVTTLIKEL